MPLRHLTLLCLFTTWCAWSTTVRPVVPHCAVELLLNQQTVNIGDPTPDRVAWAQALKVFPSSPKNVQTAVLDYFLTHSDERYRLHGVSIAAAFYKGATLQKVLAPVLMDSSVEVSGWVLDNYTGNNHRRLFTLFRTSDRPLQEKILWSLERWGKSALFPPEDIALLREIFFDGTLPHSTRALALKALMPIDAIPTTHELERELPSNVDWDHPILSATIYIALQRLAMKKQMSCEPCQQFMTRLSRSKHADQVLMAHTSLAYQFGFSAYLPMYQHVERPNRFFESEKPVTAQLVPQRLSERFNLGGKLAGKVMARWINYDRLILWQKALGLDWKKAGFDYTPIEPILTLEEVAEEFQLDESSIRSLRKLESKKKRPDDVLAFSRVIRGPDLRAVRNHFFGMTDHPETLSKTADRISQFLEKHKIYHGDLHEGNFVTQAGPTGEGQVYLIDWAD